MVYNSRFLYELPEIHNVIQKQQKKKKNKSGAKELKIALIYAFSTMSRHSIC